MSLLNFEVGSTKLAGRVADLVRLAWGLVYWNARKSVFRARKGRGRCPCQSPSDSGQALETACEACATWSRPERFRRVCPLLVRTPKGLRCSANTADVRPFWGRAALIGGGTLAGAYLAGVLAVFAFLRSIGYPVSVVHVAWPGLWYRVREERVDYYLNRAGRAFAAGKPRQGLLYLGSAYEYDPANLKAALGLAQYYQAADPILADTVYTGILRSHPEVRDAVASTWVDSLIERGSYDQIRRLASAEARVDSARANFWLHALIFASIKSGSLEGLRSMADSSGIGAACRPILAAEELVSDGRTEAAREVLKGAWPEPSPPFALYYRVDRLIRLGDPQAALEAMDSNGGGLEGASYEQLRLDAFAAAGARTAARQEADTLLYQNSRGAAQLIVCAHLVGHPDPDILSDVFDSAGALMRTLPRADALRLRYSLLCAAGACNDASRVHAVAAALKAAFPDHARAVGLAESFFSGNPDAVSITAVMPWISVPVDMDYALLDRYDRRELGPRSERGTAVETGTGR